MQVLWHLENVDLGSMLCPHKMKDASYEVFHSEKMLKKGSSVYVSNEPAKSIFFIMEGRVKISTMNEDGKEIIKVILGKGEVFGEMALTGMEKRHDEATVIENALLCIISADNMQKLMKDRSDISLFFMNIFSRRQLAIEQRLESLVFKDSRSRIIEFVINLVAKKGQRIGYEWVVRNFITHQEIANLTATSRQTVTTTLNTLRASNLLTFDRRRLLVRDLDGLKTELNT